MWNFRRGINWDLDPTGNTPIANHCFVDGLEGDDLNDGLSRVTPKKNVD